MPDPRPRQVPIAVVGIGALLPGPHGADGFWQTVVAGRDLITDVPAARWLVEDYYDPDPAAPDKTYARRGAFLSEVAFDPMAFGIPPNTLATTDTVQLLALTVAEQVLTDVGGLPGMDRDRVSVVLGAGATELLTHMTARIQRPVWLKALRENGIPEEEAQAVCDSVTDHYAPWHESTFPGLLANVIAGRIANRFDLHGTNHTTDAACASSFAALSVAMSELSLGRSDLVISGGVDASNDAGTFMCFSKTPALSPSGDCRPFSDQADGTMLGEGIAMYALKRLSDAERAGDRIYAVVRGIGTSSDGRSGAIYAPVPEGQARALRRTYEEAGFGPETVELVEAHGTGTRAGDAAEFAALRQVYEESGRDDRQWCALGSVKSQVGHTKCAAGAVGLLKSVLALHHRVLPPMIKVDRPDPAMSIDDSPFYLNTRSRPWVRPAGHPRRAAVSSFGFGGSNFHVALEEYEPSAESGGRAAWRARTAPTELVLFSAPSAPALRERKIDSSRPPADVARESQRDFRVSDPFRLAIVAADGDDLSAKLEQALALIGRQPNAPFSTPTGIHYATGAAAVGRIGFLFPGQGAQYVGMGADVAMLSPAAQAVWDRLGAMEFGRRPLHRVVFPPPAFSDEERATQQALLTETEWAQPALAVHSLALLQVLSGLGLRPDCVAGHSFGELAALHAAGALKAESLVSLARRRGELMRQAAAAPGAMLAVAAGRAQVEDILVGSGATDVWLANHNAPAQVVVSGTTGAIELIERKLAAEGITARRLHAATAFHSPIVAQASGPLLDHLRALSVSEPRLEVYGNADAAVYPSAPEEIRRRIADHLASPVLFNDEIESMYAAGVRTFVEVGAGDTLTGLVRQILGDREHLAVGLDRRGRSGVTSLQDALGRLAVWGVPLDHDDLWAPYAPPVAAGEEHKPRMTVKIDGKNHGRLYPPVGGATALPAPNPPRRLDVPSPAARPAAPAAAAPAVVEPPVGPPVVPALSAVSAVPAAADADANWFAVLDNVQRHTAEVHQACQRMLMDSHLAFLQMTETTLTAMLGAAGGERGHAQALFASPGTGAVPTVLPSAPEGSGAAALVVPSVTPTAASPVVLPEPPPVLAPPAPGVPQDVSAAGFEELLLSVVADRTGYPVGMLNVDMELESDLGVDSIKRVEILSAMRERVGDHPGGDVGELLKLRTLRQIVEAFTAAVTGGAPAASVPAARPGTDHETSAPRHEPAGRTDLGRLVLRAFDTPAPGLTLSGLGDEPIAVTEDGCGTAELVAAKLVDHGFQATAVSTVPAGCRAVVHLGGLAPLSSPEEALELQRDAFRTARSVASDFADRGGVLVTVQDTGGDFGLGGRRPERAWLGGIAALARTAAKEWPSASVKAIDCERGDRDAVGVAEAIVKELLRGGPATEVGLRADGTRMTLSAVPAPVKPGPTAGIGPDSVVVATGGARGVTAAALLDLARTHRPRIVLLGRTEPADEPPGLAAATDEAALTRALAEHSGTVAPAAIGAQARSILAAREVRTTLAALESAGSRVRYVPVDVRDGKALHDVLEEVRRDWGPITGIVHGAGVLADKLIADKTDEQYDQVLTTKVGGLRALLAATESDPLDSIVLFSSVAAVFGNAGQSDYAIANEVLNHVARAERARRPDCLVRSIAWGPWQGGMVTPELAAHFGRSGVPLISLAQGAAAFTAELGAPGADTTVVIAAGDDLNSMTVTGPAPAQVRIDAHTHPHLADHDIAGVPVLPVALALEWFAGAATAWRPNGRHLVLRDVRVFSKVALPHLDGPGHRLTLRGRGGLAEAPSVLEAELIGEDGLPHFRTHLEFETDAPQSTGWDTPQGLTAPARTEIYDGRVLFHGPRFRSIRSVHTIGADGAEATVTGVSELGWDGDHWQLDPATVDGALQLALLWAENAFGDATLPMAVAECRVHRSGPIEGAVRCVVRARKVHDTGARCDTALVDPDGLPRVELLGVELVRRPS
ncbi:SDR family NAD(P)-dependent oxidoreductase [Streptomyces rishiriensis]|uniref:Acyl transferase domain-containing protein/NADP-dependent 3-hydroxy acid dehydrogenase YdfG n=1 Tax=Streptomyces rishiriensis TaxID=68264 RepID=A0ABU0P2T1_STRRH|nr:SDR family NAD(P)-dependent oxidoreductase [Streptomyces rishiriensis]MDQ0585710.1 acyl transferase domain-containing protein/NADP-dependent 3-hydroxy acid dehydrogenase YdfG [Streptomyces rishiriensis]